VTSTSLSARRSSRTSSPCTAATPSSTAQKPARRVLTRTSMSSGHRCLLTFTYLHVCVDSKKCEGNCFYQAGTRGGLEGGSSLGQRGCKPHNVTFFYPVTRCQITRSALGAERLSKTGLVWSWHSVNCGLRMYRIGKSADVVVVGLHVRCVAKYNPHLCGVGPFLSSTTVTH
jgi:hypothetical protein